MADMLVRETFMREAVALARKYEIDAHKYIDLLTNSLFAAPVYKTYGGIIADEKYKPAGFKIRLGLKDMRLAIAAQRYVEVRGLFKGARENIAKMLAHPDAATRDLIRAGQLLKIEVLDHVILGRRTAENGRDYVSLRELGYFNA